MFGSFVLQERKLVKNIVNRTLTSFSDLKVTHGKKVSNSIAQQLILHICTVFITFILDYLYYMILQVLEVRPKADFNKGHAVNYLLEYLVNKNNWDRSQVLAIYIGDDKTDEDAFKVKFYKYHLNI